MPWGEFWDTDAAIEADPIFDIRINNTWPADIVLCAAKTSPGLVPLYQVNTWTVYLGTGHVISIRQFYVFTIIVFRLRKDTAMIDVKQVQLSKVQDNYELQAWNKD